MLHYTLKLGHAPQLNKAADVYSGRPPKPTYRHVDLSVGAIQAIVVETTKSLRPIELMYLPNMDEIPIWTAAETLRQGVSHTKDLSFHASAVVGTASGERAEF